MEEKIYTTTSGNVHYWVDAPNPALPWMVFIPGLTADHTLFAPQLAYFAGKANVFTWDAPAHAASRPYPLDFTMDDYARILHDIFAVEGVERPVYVGQSLGGYIGQVYLDLFPGSFAGFVSVDSAPLQRRYYQAWELAALERTYRMYVSIPWKLLVEWGARGVSCTPAGQANMREMMSKYDRLEFCRLAAHGYRMLARAAKADRPYVIDCPALLLCGEHDAAGSTKRYNRAWHETGGLPLEWVPGAGHNSTIDAPEYVNACIEEFAAAIA
ncbi:MAG: alpha/beta hydrolase [Coriobacteriaceae bacterium]|nr:alpha/beta hydrolase [Coriobacteriaceae bacterium]